MAIDKTRILDYGGLELRVKSINTGYLKPNAAQTGTSATIGYAVGTGAGGAVTQLTNKSTAVTLSKPTGRITMEATTAINLDTAATFTLTNTVIAANDIVQVNHVSGGTNGAYLVTAFPAAGSAVITVRNITAGNLTEAPVIAFSVLKGTIT